MYKHDCYLCSWKENNKKKETSGPLLQLKTEEKHLSLFFKNKLLLGLWTWTVKQVRRRPGLNARLSGGLGGAFRGGTPERVTGRHTCLHAL